MRRITDRGSAKVLTAANQKLEARQEELTSILAEAAAPVAPLIHPALPELYRQKVGNLRASLDDPAYQDEAAELVRSLVEAIVLTPANGELHVELRGELAGILCLCAGARQQKAPAAAASEALQVKLVAGTGFEPVTFRL